MDVRLVPGRVDDAFRALFEASFIGGTEPVFQTMGLSRDELEERMRTVGSVRTIEVDGDEAGSVWTELRDRTLHLHALLLLGGFRGRGVGTEVLRMLEDEATGSADEIELGVQDANLAARRLYEKAGFHESGRRPEIGFRVLRKSLSQAG